MPESEMMKYVVRSLPLGLFFVAGAVLLGFLAYLKRYRNDLEPGQSFLSGRSMFAELNAFNPNNYSERGRALLKWAWALTGLQLVTLAWAMLTWS